MPNLILGVCGSIAAYRAADLARDVMRAGFDVQVLLTDSASQFVTKTLFETLTGNPCLEATFEEPVPGRMAHIDWARWADVLVVAPASANTITKIAYGHGDDMLTTLALAYEGPIVVAPAMNPAMYAKPSVQEALARLQALGAEIVEPQEGDVACGEHGQGKLATNGAILKAVIEIGVRSSALAGKTVLLTSGPTREAIDDVRFLSNRSSGKMGAALARAALAMGARVIVVAGPSSASLPLRAEVHRVETALEMLDVASKFASEADLIIGVAAVADYRPAHKVSGKMRRSGEGVSIELIPNPDIIAELAKLAKPGARVVGFAAEPDPGTAEARAKLERKGLFAIAHNDVSAAGIGFESDQNALTLIRRDGEMISSGVMSKAGCARWLLDQFSFPFACEGEGRGGGAEG